MSGPYRILVTGSRTWDAPREVRVALAAAVAEAGREGRTPVVVHGACPSGADRQAANWALMHRVAHEAHPADWSQGKGAGFARNRVMVDLGADVCLAFIRDGSKGATHTAGLAAAAGIPVRYWRRDPTAMQRAAGDR